MVRKLPRTAKYGLAFLFVLLALSVALLLRTVGGRRPQSAVPAQNGGTLVASVRSEPRSFNRYVVRDTTSDLISVLTSAKLLRINRVTDQIEPWLAEHWSVTPDGLSYTLTLRTDVTYSDGTPFSSADVLFAFRAVYDPQVASPLVDALRVGGRPLAVVAPDTSTVVITFPSPFGPGLRLLDNLPILPRHRLESSLGEGTFQKAWSLTTAPSELTGLGPFVLKEYVPGERLVFDRNARYWRKDDNGVTLPYLDRVRIEIVPEQSMEILRLESGELDLVQSEIRPEDYTALKRAADAGRLQLVDLGVGLDPNFMWFNLKPEAKAADPRRLWLQSVELRRAVSHAVDRQAFVDTVLLGAGVPVHGPVTPGNRIWFSSETPKYPYDPERARTLLASVGLSDRDGDGRLEDARGIPARFSLLTQKGNTARERGSAVIQEDLRKTGLTVDVVTLEANAVIDRLTRGDYDAIYFGSVASDTDPAINLDFWLSTGAFHAWNPEQQRPATQWEQRIDELMHLQVASVDQAERKRLFDQVQRVFAEQQPALYFAAPHVIIAMSSRVANAAPALLRPQVLWNADTLAIRNGKTGEQASGQ